MTEPARTYCAPNPANGLAICLAISFSISLAISLSIPLAPGPVFAEETAEAKAMPKRKPLKLPGMIIDFQKRQVDLEATVCLEHGLLELVACTKGSKEHESIVAVSARAMHIHTALLLLGADNGHPAMRKQRSDETGWIDVPPRGDPIDVFLVTDEKGKQVERPISEFIIHSSERVDEVDGEILVAPRPSQTSPKMKRSLGHTFTFAGSQLRDNGDQPRIYLADVSGHVISIATFGDELLCLPSRQTQKNDDLMWRIKPNSLPKRGAKVVLRLRPHRVDKSQAKAIVNARPTVANAEPASRNSQTNKDAKSNKAAQTKNSPGISTQAHGNDNRP